MIITIQSYIRQSCPFFYVLKSTYNIYNESYSINSSAKPLQNITHLSVPLVCGCAVSLLLRPWRHHVARLVWVLCIYQSRYTIDNNHVTIVPRCSNTFRLPTLIQRWKFHIRRASAWIGQPRVDIPQSGTNFIDPIRSACGDGDRWVDRDLNSKPTWHAPLRCSRQSIDTIL